MSKRTATAERIASPGTQRPLTTDGHREHTRTTLGEDVIQLSTIADAASLNDGMQVTAVESTTGGRGKTTPAH